MQSELEKLLKNLRNKKIGIFVDDSNIYHAYQKYKWRIDFHKLKSFLSEYGKVCFVNYYVAIPGENDMNYPGTITFLDRIDNAVKIKRKKLKYIYINGRVHKKGDVDIEIALDVVRNIEILGVIIILTGDSDYLELKNYVVNERGKELIFMGYEENMAWELRKCKHIYLNRIKKVIELNKKPQD
ncbi:MAG: NYN domain-containing protein [Actinobacteria bacterium]|nr:NYN domain-containing protein [Actinomycetota bacterium]